MVTGQSKQAQMPTSKHRKYQRSSTAIPDFVNCTYIKLLVVRILDIRGEQWRPDLKNLFVLINAHGMQKMGLGVVCCAFSQVLMIYLRCKLLGLSGINILLYFSNTFWLGLFTQRLSGEPFGQPVISENRFGQESFGR